MKGLAIVAALLIGGASLAMAQNGPASGSQPPVAGGAAASGQNAQAITPSRHVTKHHKRMYMSAKSTHKHKKMYMSAKSHKGTLKDNSRVQAVPSK
jgi:hypothetical protein